MSSIRIKRITFVVSDILIVILSAFMQMALRFGFFNIKTCGYYDEVIKWLPLDCFIAVVVMLVFKLYNRVWTFASIDVLRDITFATLVIEAVFYIYKMLLGVEIPRSFLVFNWMSLFLCFCASRLSVRLVRRMLIRRRADDNSKHIMIVGGGRAGSLLIKDMINSPLENITPICVIDDNPDKKGSLINYIPIVGNRHDIPQMVRKYDINEIIIAIPSAHPDDVKDIYGIASTTKAKILTMPSISSSITGSVIHTVREINYEDLLQREPIKIANPELADYIHGKTILVTGGGGSIGSELCRQILANKPAQLVLVDIYENTTYTLERELRESFPEAKLYVRIGSIRDYDRMEALIAEFQPNIIYHAAAHKHVPLMEVSPNEAVKNNCLGTLNMVKLADKYKVDKFVMISTDKAVNPTNVMGATKRICEMIIQSWNRRSDTEFVAVRFGNVLGSNGSVIPIFLKQIEKRQPITLTHREITRYFMTIPEAVSLVLTAGLMAKGGEIFVLDMGEPVKIYDLACNLIRMKGLEPHKDIQIDVVGLRPGEKLYEELLMDEEGLEKTEHHLIHIGKPIEMNDESFEKSLNELIHNAESDNEIISDIKNICPTYSKVSY